MRTWCTLHETAIIQAIIIIIIIIITRYRCCGYTRARGNPTERQADEAARTMEFQSLELAKLTVNCTSKTNGVGKTVYNRGECTIGNVPGRRMYQIGLYIYNITLLYAE